MAFISSSAFPSGSLRMPYTFSNYWPRTSISFIPTLTSITHSLSNKTSLGRTSTSFLLPFMEMVLKSKTFSWHRFKKHLLALIRDISLPDMVLLLNYIPSDVRYGVTSVEFSIICHFLSYNFALILFCHDLSL